MGGRKRRLVIEDMVYDNHLARLLKKWSFDNIRNAATAGTHTERRAEVAALIMRMICIMTVCLIYGGLNGIIMMRVLRIIAGNESQEEQVYAEQAAKEPHMAKIDNDEYP